MGYFEDNYKEVKYTIREGVSPGLRRAQIGAIHAIASYFTLREQPGIVVMPTGSGKTAVLMLATFVLRSARTLIITPSRLVRYQIKQDFESLKTLKKADALRTTLSSPKVYEVVSKIKTENEWEKLRNYDVVVVAPNSSSPILEGIAQPPPDLFDLVLVDEAHHSRANTWEALLDSFPSAKRILFTATPFRRDQRELNGRLIYSYPVSLAYEDGIFGKIEYYPVEEIGDENDDLRIAVQAAQLFEEDRQNGFEHLLMVRTDSKKRARELKKIYQEKTSLNLQLIDSDQSFAHIQKTIEKLRAQELDGVICVDMMGEGFDLPQLKIAAIHAPHKSLAITLQFIGRFARTNAHNIGTAKFLAVPSSVKGEMDRLYIEGAVWQEIVTQLSQSKIEDEVESREILESFESPTKESPETENLSLFSLRPYSHVKIFQLGKDGEVDLACDLPSGLEVVYRRTSFQHSMDLFITKDTIKPRWSSSEQFAGAEHHLFIVYFDAKTKLLFINSSCRNEILYDAIANSYAETIPSQLPLNKVNKVLVDLVKFDFFNIGMRSNLLKSNTESYRTLAGSSAQKAINRSDSRLYNRGHIFGRAQEGEKAVTIGYSSSSKVWSNSPSRIPQLLRWCRTLAERISSNREVVTSSGLDWLPVGKTVSRIPDGVIAAEWDVDVYNKQPLIRYLAEDGSFPVVPLLDFDLKVDRSNSDRDKIRVSISNDEIQFLVDFSLQTEKFFTPVDAEQSQHIHVLKGNYNYLLTEYLNVRLLNFFFADFSILCGSEYFGTSNLDIEPFDKESQTAVLDWGSENVDIEKECGPCSGGKISIQDYLRNHLPKSDAEIVFFDHGTGEVADFVTLSQISDEIIVRFYHCKGAGGASATSERVDDVYEVCGQVLKSLIWTNSNKLHEQILYRSRTRKNSVFLKGEKTKLRELFALMRTVPTFYEIFVVQPGISRSSIPDKIGYVLAGANDYIVKGMCKPLVLVCSG